MVDTSLVTQLASEGYHTLQVPQFSIDVFGPNDEDHTDYVTDYLIPVKSSGHSSRIAAGQEVPWAFMYLSRKGWNHYYNDIKAAFKTASEGSHKGILGVDEEYRVSQDFVGEALSTVVPLDTIQVIGGNMVKVLSWYDNEWGYSCRLVDMAIHISKEA